MGWLDRLKGTALAWIFLNHASEQLLGSPYIANPHPDWPPLEERVRQLLPLQGYGLWDVPVNLFRWIGWMGDAGVQLFLIASGFGLVWGALRAGTPDPLRAVDFYRRRMFRIYPMWIAVHLAVFLGWIFLGTPMGLPWLKSLVGIRCTPSTMYWFAPAWWYIGLLLQLYLVFPLLWTLLRKTGPLRFAGGCVAIGFAARAAGLAWSGDFLDPWLRGAVFITRLPEFAFGMSLAWGVRSSPGKLEAMLRKPGTLLASALTFVVAAGLAMTWSGNTVAPFLLGVTLFALLVPVLDRANGRVGRTLGWIGVHSYALFLVHHSILERLLGSSPVVFGAGTLLRLGGAAALTGIAGIVLERGVAAVERRMGRAVTRFGTRRVVLGTAAVGAAVGVLLIGAELLSRRIAPAELQGRGERPSLEPDSRFGWRLRPSRSTRLRWESTDYTVSANSLGFPGPEVAPEKPAGTFRVLVTGDAFSSAEGVDTDRSWPRLLEVRLSRSKGGAKVEVLNFSITGFGPDQCARVVEHFAPIYRPDLVLVEMYVNEVDDVRTPDASFVEQIGFGKPDPERPKSILQLANLRAVLSLHVRLPLKSWLKSRPDDNAAFLRGLAYVDRAREAEFEAAGRMIGERIRRIRATSGAPVAILMVPAAVQLASARSLPLFPRFVDLDDRERYDLDLPQRLMRTVAEREGAAFVDLRPVLAGLPECPYHPRNMHWTEAGHDAVASHLAPAIAEDGLGGRREAPR